MFCEHQRNARSRPTGGRTLDVELDRYAHVDAQDEIRALPSTERRSSDPSSAQSLNTRVSLTWPSFSRHSQNRRAATMASNASVRSAPPSRSSSRIASERQVSFDDNALSSRPVTILSTASRMQAFCGDAGMNWSFPSTCLPTVDTRTQQDDPVEREELSATPLLPPSLVACPNDEPDSPRSPLQSPSIAAASTTNSVVGSPLVSPLTQSFSSPALSAKPSSNSLSIGLSKCSLQASFDGLPDILTEEPDDWSFKLGHANFHILPEPYVPAICDTESCLKLLEDWNAAKNDFLKQAARIGEHYGGTSQIYYHAGEKWQGIEAQWQSNFAIACNAARAAGETIELQPLEPTESFLIPCNFPDLDQVNIVGPMVQYARPQPSPTKRQTFLRLFTDPASILRKP